MKKLLVSIGTFVATATFFLTIIVPIFTQSLNNEVATLKRELSDLRETEKVNEELVLKVAALEASVGVLETRNAQLKRGNLFVDGSLFLHGYNRVVVGDSVESVLGLFPEARMRRNDALIEVKFDDGFIEHIVYAYHFSDDSIIGSVVYTPERSSDMSLIVERFNAAHPGVLKRHTDQHSGNVSHTGHLNGLCVSLNSSFYKIDLVKSAASCF